MAFTTLESHSLRFCRFLVQCIFCLWTLILNGWTSSLCSPSHQQKPLRNYGSCSLTMVCHIKSSLTMDHHLLALYYPSTNGLAERAVQSFKQAVKRIAGDTVQERISKFLFTYRITPHSVTGVAPAELLMGRRLRSRLDTWHPDLSKKVSYQQERQKRNHDSTIHAKNYTSSYLQWLAGTVIEVTGPLSYKVILECGNNIVRRHVDSVRPRHT